MFLDLSQKLTTDALAAYAKVNRLKIGLTSGCYDLTHYYHLKYFERCKRECDILVVGVDVDSLIRAVKGPSRPIFNETHRLALVESSRFVDAAYLMHGIIDFERMIDALEVNYIFKNQDFRNNEKLVILGAEKVEKIIYVDDIEEITSTSSFIKKIQSIK